MDRLNNFFRKYFFVTNSPESKAFEKSIYEITRLQPTNISLYKLALQHSSVKEAPHSNERLEFLGDAVLSLIVAEYLFKKYPLQKEGFLTKIRSCIVNRESLDELAQKIGIDVLLVYDTRSMRSDPNIYGNALEAFIGAAYLDQGYEKCRKFVIDRLINMHIDLKFLIQTDRNYKTKIICWAQRNRKEVVFKLISVKRTKNSKEFVVHILVEDHVIGQGNGRTKKQAEQMAAQDALTKLQ